MDCDTEKGKWPCYSGDLKLNHSERDHDEGHDFLVRVIIRAEIALSVGILRSGKVDDANRRCGNGSAVLAVVHPN